MGEVTKLISKQVSLWEIRRRLATADQRPGRKQIGGIHYGPYLLVSRQHGSGGDQIARTAGERLGWHVFDRQIVDGVASRAHVRQQLILSLDERARTAFEDTFRSAFEPEDIGSENYILYLKQVVLALGHQGDVVLVGRGAQYMLPVECGLRVRIVAPAEWRAKQIAERLRLPIEEARREVQQSDTSQQAFVRQYFHHDAGDTLNYDVIINTAEVGVEGAADLVVLALERKLGVQPKQ
ncbi:MAG: cytidylate kinase-like family protein [Verrucomicrobia bacterium]|nr:cytidylate kinase-like family protein [Verrucomicrobiota bacterium]